MDGNQIAAMIDGERITSDWRTRVETQTVSNEEAYAIVEHAIDYLSTRGYPCDAILAAIDTLHEAHKAIGPLGQIPSWEEKYAR